MKTKPFILTTPHGPIWELVKTMQCLMQEIENERDENIERRKTVLCLYLAILIVETFINIFFERLVENKTYSNFKNIIKMDLSKPESLDYKVKNWPQLLFNKKLDLSQGVGQQFILLKKFRNSQMHYRYTNESLDLNGLKITGLTDVYDSHKLTRKNADEYYKIMWQFIKHIIETSGSTQEKSPFKLQLWTSIII